MPPPAIRVRNLSKKYQIGAREARPTSFREALTGALASPFRRFQNLRGTSSQAETFWALKDVSFDIEEGEVVGVIGRNGAGKSTLLKILSQITEPTSGEVELHGRVGSLLEVGTGFHPELSGRENIYLNGAILGMKREEITKRFDEIVAFADVEQFLDTPVKRYSSGMYMRLAFAVAAHLEPEILIVDEVLAVGDAGFQKKCLGKMGAVAKAGRTVLFVSHQMAAVEALCDRCLLLANGAVCRWGDTSLIVSEYLRANNPLATSTWISRDGLPRERSREPAIKRITLTDLARTECSSIGMGDGLGVLIHFKLSRPLVRPYFGVGINDEVGKRLVSFNNLFLRDEHVKCNRECMDAGVAYFEIPSLPLMEGVYNITVSIVDNAMQWVDCIEGAVTFAVEPRDVFGSTKVPSNGQGCFFLPASITIDAI